ncbi:MAG: M1 family metallopeptidase [Ignavibacteriales bacterium]|nr:M1 family metallopeptidase [Ignavibacteriales bacterium]
MKKTSLAFLEYGFLAIVFILLVAFIGTPPSENDALPQIHSPSTPALQQGTKAWDKNLELPTQSDRIVHYTMDVKLDVKTNIVSGWEVLEWNNTTGKPQNTFPFHLYHNAWKNNRSTFAKESGGQLSRPHMSDEDYGYTNVKSVKVINAWGETDITNTFKYIQPDDNNADDQTVFQITTPAAVPAGKILKLKIEFETKQPLPISRTGAIRTYHFIAQWFPKIGVWWKGAWNCHQFHANTEFFADYGIYDVNVTVPSNYAVGATGGLPRKEQQNSDSTKTYNFYQEDVHDFAWLTSPDLVRSVRKFVHKEMDPNEQPDRHHPLKEVTVILLTQPHHSNVIERYFDATLKALRYYGEWYGEYPYEAVTVVDPANDSRSGGMEYPTLFTGGANMYAPKEAPSPESVTVHEFGHQFWYGMIGNNEFEEAWLDEGFNSYSQDRVMNYAWQPFKAIRYFFGGPGAGTYVGIPYVFHEVNQSRYGAGNSELRRFGKNDVMARKGWEYNQTYGLNSYTKPAMSLIMLERYLGEEMMYRVMRTYHHRYRFKHPTTQDFINTVNEVSGKNMNWFFENTWFSSNLFDYSVDRITNTKIPKPAGVFNFNGTAHESAAASSQTEYACEVVVKREGEAIAPVEVLIVFKNGDQKREQWDGQYRWKKFTYFTNSLVSYAIVDPERKLAMDINYNNNGKAVRDEDYQSVAARKYASKAMFWVQNFFEFTNF